MFFFLTELLKWLELTGMKMIRVLGVVQINRPGACAPVGVFFIRI